MFRRVRGSTLTRSRWAGLGAAVAVSLGAGGIGFIAHAANSAPSSFVSITPCRLFDTRPAPANVGDRNTPLAAGEDFVRQVTGTNGDCTIPAGATAISYNLTVPNGLDGFLTLYPADAISRPSTSTINPVTGQGVKVNGGIVGLSAAGAIKLYSLRGPVDALLDITGYFAPGIAGPAGPSGPIGPTGPAGAPGPAGPTLVATGLVDKDGAVLFTTGQLPTVVHLAPGKWSIAMTGFGTGCPAPQLTSNGIAQTFYTDGGACNSGNISTVVRSSNDLDGAGFWYMFVRSG
jgi:hypothetical protein